MTIPHEAINPCKAVRPKTPFYWNSNTLYKSWGGERVANGRSKTAHTMNPHSVIARPSIASVASSTIPTRSDRGEFSNLANRCTVSS